MKLFNRVFKLISLMGQKPYAIHLKETQQTRIVFPNQRGPFTLVIPLGNYFYYEHGVAIPEDEDFDYLFLSREEMTGVYVARHYLENFLKVTQPAILGDNKSTGPLGAVFPVNDLLPCLKMFLWKTWKKYDIVGKVDQSYPEIGNSPELWRHSISGNTLVRLMDVFTPVGLAFVKGHSEFSIIYPIDVTQLSANWVKVPITDSVSKGLFSLHQRIHLHIQTKAQVSGVTYPNITLPASIREHIIPDYQNAIKLPLLNEGDIAPSPMPAS